LTALKGAICINPSSVVEVIIVYINPIKLHAGMNPNFFKGTVLEHEANKVLADLSAKNEGHRRT
jgi:hypothetical protein